MNKFTEEQKYQRYLQAQDAIRDILYMYKTCVEYKCLFEDFGLEDGKFDPFVFVDCDPEMVGGDSSDAKLLREGSTIKIVCTILQAWGQGSYPETDTVFTKDAKKLVKSGRLEKYQSQKTFIELSLASYEDTVEKSAEVYSMQVVGYFQRMLAWMLFVRALGYQSMGAPSAKITALQI